MAIETGEIIRGYKLQFDISGYSGLFPYLESATDGKSSSIRAWREKDGTARGWTEGRTQLDGFTYDSRGERAMITSEEAERVIAAHARITAERAAAREAEKAAPVPARAAVPAMAEIAAACDAEKTPLAPTPPSRPARRCVECGSMVYGDHCTHCHEG